MLSAEALETRKTGIGGSDAAAAVGLSPWKSPVQLWLEKTGTVEPDDLSSNERVHFGNVLEDVIADEFKRRSGLNVQRHRATLRSPAHPFMLANIDRRIVGAKEGLEIKTADARTASQWGDGGDEIPMHYLLQCAHYMAVTGWQRWHVAVLIGGNDYRQYCIDRNEVLMERLIENERVFWQHVIDQVAPTPKTAADVALLYPNDNGQSILATDEIRAHIESLKGLRREMKALEAGIDAHEEAIKKFLGDHADIIFGDDGKKLVTWKSHETSRLDSTGLRKAYPELATQFTRTTTARPFKII
jgi:putative phage-type endonuclease